MTTNETPSALMWFDRENGVWNRFDKDNLAGVDPSTLAVLPFQTVDTLYPDVNIVDSWKELAEARELVFKLTRALEDSLSLTRSLCPVRLMDHVQSGIYYELYAAFLEAKKHDWVAAEYAECG